MAQFPEGPDARLTPGALCDQPDSYRYPEHIPYCSRAVDTQTKNEVIADYDHELGYQVEEMNRADFKIDHFIPLCMGGGNVKENLWPQNVSVYTITDPLEPLACEKMAEGKLKQADAVALIRKGKNDLSTVPSVLQYLNSL